MRANAPANARQWIRIARQTIGLFESSLRDQTDVASGIGMRRTRHHAGKIRVQPIRVNFLVFESLEHRGTLSSRPYVNPSTLGKRNAGSGYCPPPRIG